MKNKQRFSAKVLPLIALVTMTAAPIVSIATPNVVVQQHRQKTKNDWRNLAYVAGGLGLWGLLKHDNTLTFLGAAGALYSAQRYEHDRRSQSNSDRARAKMFSQGSFTRGGHRYVKRTVMKNGHKFYRFVRVS